MEYLGEYGTLGEAELIDFATGGKIVKRLMRPVLDGVGGWLRWVPAEEEGR